MSMVRLGSIASAMRQHVLNTHVLLAAVITVIAVALIAVIPMVSQSRAVEVELVGMQSHLQPDIPGPEAPCELCTPEGWDRFVEKLRQRGVILDEPRPDQYFVPEMNNTGLTLF